MSHTISLPPPAFEQEEGPSNPPCLVPVLLASSEVTLQSLENGIAHLQFGAPSLSKL